MSKILVADDMKGITKAIERILNEEGHEVVICQDGQKAIDAIDKDNFDLVITDILMPEKDGLEVAKYIRTKLSQNKRNVPILAVTGGGSLVSSEMAIEASKLHTDAILIKPFDSQSFIEMVNKLLA